MPVVKTVSSQQANGQAEQLAMAQYSVGCMEHRPQPAFDTAYSSGDRVCSLVDRGPAVGIPESNPTSSLSFGTQTNLNMALQAAPCCESVHRCFEFGITVISQNIRRIRRKISQYLKPLPNVTNGLDWHRPGQLSNPGDRLSRARTVTHPAHSRCSQTGSLAALYYVRGTTAWVCFAGGGETGTIHLEPL